MNSVNHLQAVFPEGGARLHDVHDDVREAQDGGQLNGTVQLDDVDVPAHGRRNSFLQC